MVGRGVAFYEAKKKEFSSQLAHEEMQVERRSLIRRMGQIGQMIVGGGQYGIDHDPYGAGGVCGSGIAVVAGAVFAKKLSGN